MRLSGASAQVFDKVNLISHHEFAGKDRPCARQQPRPRRQTDNHQPNRIDGQLGNVTGMAARQRLPKNQQHSLRQRHCPYRPIKIAPLQCLRP